MTKPIKLILFTVIILAATVSAAYTLILLDQVVNGLTYTYGFLQFDLRWAIPYWTFIRITLTLLGVIVVTTVINTIHILRKYVYVKKSSEKMAASQKPTMPVHSPTRPVERVQTMPVAPPTATSTPPTPPAPSVPAPRSSPLLSDIPGLIKCFHCGKAFTQPLRMLDFQGDRPRIVNICPFCNEIIPTAPRQEEKEQDKRFLLRKKNNNDVPKTFASQTTS